MGLKILMGNIIVINVIQITLLFIVLRNKQFIILIAVMVILIEIKLYYKCNDWMKGNPGCDEN